MAEPRTASRTAPRLVATFADAEGALRAARALVAAGVAPARLGLLAPDPAAGQAALDAVGFPVRIADDDPAALADAIAPAARDELAGAALGGTVGLAAAAGVLLTPGLPALLAAASGTVLALELLTPAAVGAAVGTLLGAAWEEDLAERHRDRWHYALESGGWLVVVRDPDVARAEAALREAGATHVDVLLGAA